MFAVCTICGDIFTGTHPEIVHSTPCGHLFHDTCLTKWLERSKTCPQCRSRVNDGKTIKLYFQISSNQATQDAGSLENELQNLRFQMSMQKMDIEKVTADKELAVNQTSGLRKMLKQREEECRTHETVVSNLQDKIKILKCQMKSLVEVECQAAELASKLEKYESLDAILKGSAHTASDALNSMRDKDSNTLCTCISILKKEIDQYKEKNRYLQNQLRKTEKELSSCFAEIDKLRGMNSVLNRAVAQYKTSPTTLSRKMISPNIVAKNLNHSDVSIVATAGTSRESKVTTPSTSKVLDVSIASSSKYLSVPEKVSVNDEPSLIRHETMIDLSASPIKKPTVYIPSPRSPILLSRFHNGKDKNLLTKNRIVPKIPNVGTQCYDGLGGHLIDEVTCTDRATLLREIEDRKPNRLQLPRKRLKTRSIRNSESILRFCSKKT